MQGFRRQHKASVGVFLIQSPASVRLLAGFSSVTLQQPYAISLPYLIKAWRIRGA